LASFLLLQVPQLARKHAAAEGTVMDADELVALVAEDQEVLGVDVGDDGSVREQVRLRLPRQLAVDQAAHLVAAAHWMVLAPCTPMSLGTTLRLMCRSRLIT